MYTPGKGSCSRPTAQSSIDPQTGEMTALIQETAEWAMELSRTLDPVVYGRLSPRTGRDAAFQLLIQMLQMVSEIEKTEQVQVCGSLKEWLL